MSRDSVFPIEVRFTLKGCAKKNTEGKVAKFAKLLSALLSQVRREHKTKTITIFSILDENEGVELEVSALIPLTEDDVKTLPKNLLPTQTIPCRTEKN